MKFIQILISRLWPWVKVSIFRMHSMILCVRKCVCVRVRVCVREQCTSLGDDGVHTMCMLPCVAVCCSVVCCVAVCCVSVDCSVSLSSVSDNRECQLRLPIYVSALPTYAALPTYVWISCSYLCSSPCLSMYALYLPMHVHYPLMLTKIRINKDNEYTRWLCIFTTLSRGDNKCIYS